MATLNLFLSQNQAWKLHGSTFVCELVTVFTFEQL